MRRLRIPAAIGTVALVALAVRCSAQAPAAVLIRQVPWSGKGVWLAADTHVHTKFSDGAGTPAETAAKARSFGCDVVGFADHGDNDRKGATPEYFDAIDEARRTQPEMVVMGGMEWNLPPWGGDEHATVFVPAAKERRLTEFKASFDDYGRDKHEAALAVAGLQWLAAQATDGPTRPIVTYEHPSRKDAKSMENVDDMRAWRKVNDIVIGFAGAPGHQGKPPIGGYNYNEKPIDRWDPVAARPGDAWDTLLNSGLDIWAAYAPSDYHSADPNDIGDTWPCEFTKTWIYAPERTQSGVLQAFRAGSFFAVHGGIVERAEISVTAKGLPRAASAGEALRVAAGTAVIVEVTMRVPEKDWRGEPNRVDLVEIIGIDATGAKVMASAPAGGGPALSLAVTVPATGLVVRARGFRTMTDGARLAFYTNPVRIQTGR
ncbi:MAG TPA: PHP domain-containing protein [Vicinamibacterales bacterium]|nr:PHP domain-containing protein [Vicinamibacterales bacterium]